MNLLLVDDYLLKSTADNNEETRRAIRSYIIRFCSAIPEIENDKLDRESFIDAFNNMHLYGRNTFYTAKTYIYEFLLWLIGEHQLTEQQLEDFKSISYNDVERDHIYDTYYFHSYSDLIYNLDEAIQLRNPDNTEVGDVAKAVATLSWFGFDIDIIADIKKSDLLEIEQCVVHPVTKKKHYLPESAISFLSEFRDAESFLSLKMLHDNYITMYYKESAYLIRNTRAAHLSRIQLNNSFKYINSISDEIGKRFLISKIYWSGLCCRIYYDEQNNGLIKAKDVDRLQRLFEVEGETTPSVRNKLRTDLVQYQEFKQRMLAPNAE